MREYNFCTLFDRNYLYKGLALYDSLTQVCRNFKLWILCFDDIAYGLLKKMDLKNIILISLSEFEDEGLLGVKNSRTPVEYCWTTTPSLPLYILKKWNKIDSIAYLDADLYFYADPFVIYEELDSGSILVVSHNYSKRYAKNELKHGKFNVQFLIFKNNVEGLRCLEWWRDKCLDWCYVRYESRKWGDQKYLDEWPQRFSGVKVLSHKGGGVAPWNIQNYDIKKVEDKIFIDDQELVFYHFHQLNIINPNAYDLSRGYPLSRNVIELIYKPYISQLRKQIDLVSKLDPGFNYGFDLRYALRPSSFKTMIESLALRNKFIYNFSRKYIGRLIGKYFYLYNLKGEHN